MRTITKLRRSTKGLSPIFATLILIAIAVIAGIVVYMFTSGFIGNLTGSTTTGSEKVAVQSASGAGKTPTVAGDKIIVYAQYVAGGSAININGAIVKDSDGTNIVLATTTPIAISPDSNLPTSGALETITITLKGGTDVLQVGHVYSVTLTSSKGGSFVAPAFTAP